MQYKMLYVDFFLKKILRNFLTQIENFCFSPTVTGEVRQKITVKNVMSVFFIINTLWSMRDFPHLSCVTI